MRVLIVGAIFWRPKAKRLKKVLPGSSKLMFDVLLWLGVIEFVRPDAASLFNAVLVLQWILMPAAGAKEALVFARIVEVNKRFLGLRWGP
jgi:hypothetical protein